MLVAVVNPLLGDEPVTHVEHDHSLPAPPLAIAFGRTVEKGDGVIGTRHHVVQLEALRSAKRLAAAPEQFEDLLRSAVGAPELVASDVVHCRVGRIESRRLRVVSADGLEIATDEVDGRFGSHAGARILATVAVTLRMDHVAFAVWDLSKAASFWGGVMEGQYRQGYADWHGFAFLQFAFAGGGRVEILAPGSDPTGFVVKFLRRFGEGLHHVTFMVDDLHAHADRVRAAGHRVFGEDYTDPQWMEAFFGMDLAGSRVLIQLAQSELTNEEQDEAFGRIPLGAVLEVAAQRPDLR